MIFDLVIPCYNPSKGWEKKLYKKYLELSEQYFEGNTAAIQLIVVNDGSAKNFSEKEITFLKDRIPSVVIVSYAENKGKGFALREGIKNAGSPYCVYSDYDFPFGVAIIADIYKNLLKGADIVTGCRQNGNYIDKATFKRKLISNGLMFLNKVVFKLPVNDTQAGIKGFNRYGKKFFLDTTINRFLFDLEFILLASKMDDMIITPLNVSVTDDVRLTNFGFKTLVHEGKNLFKLISRKYAKTNKEDIIQYRPGRI
jgi:glycosyltransferase involved in cell wall biosynthesis